MGECSDMNHLSEEQMILHFYDEPGGAEEAARHLNECAECLSRFEALRTLLNSVDALGVPERGDEYGSQVWKRVEWRMRGVRPSRSFAQWQQWGAIAAMLLVGVAGYVLGKREVRVEVADVAPRELMVEPQTSSSAQQGAA